jgi:hypothetical protein
MADTKKTVLAVLGAIFLIVIIVIVSAIGGLAYFVRTHMHAQQTTSETANQEIAQVRARFAGQAPMIERRARDDDDDDRFIVHRAPATARKADLDALHVIAYDPSEHRMMRVSVPFWLIRLAPGRSIRFPDDSDVDLGRTHLTVDDLERHGPGLILDTRDRHGAEVIVWVE